MAALHPASDALCAALLDVVGRAVLAAGLEQLGNVDLVEAFLPTAEFAADFHLALLAQNVIHFVLPQALQHGRDPLAAALAVKGRYQFMLRPGEAQQGLVPE